MPGNHDHHLLSAWLERRARDGIAPELGLESAVEWAPGRGAGNGGAWLRGRDRVRVAYPGVWLRDDVYATHGHYCDRHTTVPMFERLGAGAMARIVREPADGPRRAEDYEAALGADLRLDPRASPRAAGPESARARTGPPRRRGARWPGSTTAEHGGGGL